LNCPQPQPLSHGVLPNAVTGTFGDTRGQLEDKTLVCIRVGKESLNSRARVGTTSRDLSPPVLTLMGTAFPQLIRQYGPASAVSSDGQREEDVRES
jgi:hypothetical protein